LDRRHLARCIIHCNPKAALMKILVLGGAESGTGAALLAKKQGLSVMVSDAGAIKPVYRQQLIAAGIAFEEGGHSAAFLADTTTVVKSPGIPDEAQMVVELKASGAEIISEIEFASRYTAAKIVAITGTNGKTTTTLLTYHILKKAGLDVAVAGNVGKSFAGVLADRDYACFVLEVSSFQLDNITQFRPDIAVILNITPDHLDRYQYQLANYVKAKFEIGKFQTATDHFIYSADDPILTEALDNFPLKAEKHPISIKVPVENGAFLDNDFIKHSLTLKSFEMSIHELALQGKHNAYNSMAASIAARIFEIRKEVVRESLSDFQNIEHRLEFVAQIHGIKFINDSKATNVNSTWYALESCNEPVVWIVGGVDKGNDYSMLESLVREKVKAIVCLGKDNKKIIDYFSPFVENIAEAQSADDAVALGYRYGRKGDVVLLSPACASFDLFENYEDRGHQFKRAIRAL